LRTRQARKITASLAIGLFALAACGADKPSQDSLKNKLKSESEFSSLTDSQVNCIAGALLKYAKGSDLGDYVAGKKKMEEVRGPAKNEGDLTKATEDCVTAK
jgi:hypothetical protein